MRYFLGIFFLPFLYCNFIFCAGLKLYKNHNLSVDAVEELKENFQEDQLEKKINIFDCLQNYGRLAGQLATSVVLISSLGCEKKSQKSSFSVGEKSNIIQATVTCFLLMVEMVKYCHACKVEKCAIKAISYQEFVTNFPHLVLVEHQILLMKRLIDLSVKGTLPERVFAVLQLTKSSLPFPYKKFAEKSAKKMYKKCFDEFGNFVLVELHANQHPYKKFRKKVAQDWYEIVLQVNKFEKVIEPSYDSAYVSLIDTSYNNALVKMIHAGMKEDMITVQSVRNLYVGNVLIEQLYNHFMCV